MLALIGAAVIEIEGTRPLHGWYSVVGSIVAVGFGSIGFHFCERLFLHKRLRIELGT